MGTIVSQSIEVALFLELVADDQIRCPVGRPANDLNRVRESKTQNREMTPQKTKILWATPKILESHPIFR